MAHGKERKEKVCLNCNARVFGPYCHVCGQHNIEPKETLIGLVVHFFNDITHFEGKFISSLRYLLFRPGFLTKEYERGRRASYMNPVRMYVFASAFFFIIFFSFFSRSGDEIINVKAPADSAGFKIPEVNINSNTLSEEGLKNAETAEDSALIKKMFGAKAKTETSSNDTVQSTGILGIADNRYKTIKEYDSAQAALPKEQRNNWFEKLVVKRIIIVNEKYKGDLKAFNKAFYEYIIHALPKVLFVSLPIFAFLIFLLYVRHSRYFYVTHIIFTIHLFVFYFIMLLILFSSNKLGTIFSWWPSNLLALIIWLYMFYYLYKAMRRTYEQQRTKTLLKYFILLFLSLLLYAFLTIMLFSYSIFNV